MSSFVRRPDEDATDDPIGYFRREMARRGILDEKAVAYGVERLVSKLRSDWSRSQWRGIKSSFGKVKGR